MKNQVKIKHLTTDHAQENQFVNFADKISNMASKLIIESVKGKNNLPGFLLKENVMYSALALDKELKPFLEALSQKDSTRAGFSEPLLSGSALSKPIRQALDKINIPVQLKLYIALQCPHCPLVVKTMIPLAFYCKNIHLHIIDGSLFPETAQKDKVMSAPCLILDDDFRWTGSVMADEVIKMITNRDPSQLSAKTLQTILEQGDASWISHEMIKKDLIFESFIKLLLHATWSVRLGAMVIVEELAEASPELAARLCPLLIDQFDKKDVPIQGDILYALGEAGDLDTKKWIQTKLSKFEHPDLIDAAKDALDTLEEKQL